MIFMDHYFSAGQIGTVLSLLWPMWYRAKRQLIFLLFFLVGCSPAESQIISGTLSQHASQEIRLEGFNGFSTYEISRTMVSANGSFTLSYSEEEIGLGQLVSAGGGTFILVLSGEDIELKGLSLGQPESINLLGGQENLLFEQYASEHPRREQTLSAWIYLQRIYLSDSLFTVQHAAKHAITEEIERIRMEDYTFIEELPLDSYLSWYLPVRKLVQSVPVVAQFRTEEIPETIQAFRELDHTESRLFKSGLLGDVIESHVWLIENSGRSLDSVYVELNHSVDGLIESLAEDTLKLNKISEYLFDLLEQRSLFTSSEYLANVLLKSYSQSLNTRLADKLEIYRAVKVGNIAPDIHFSENTVHPEGATSNHLSDIDADFILVVFAAGWCPNCMEMMSELTETYPNWQKYGVEVVLVSLDDTPESYDQFTTDLPFLRTTDYLRWESPIVRNYHVHRIPSMYLLDQNLEILLHPKSIGHMDAWVNWYLDP